MWWFRLGKRDRSMLGYLPETPVTDCTGVKRPGSVAAAVVGTVLESHTNTLHTLAKR